MPSRSGRAVRMSRDRRGAKGPSQLPFSGRKWGNALLLALAGLCPGCTEPETGPPRSFGGGFDLSLLSPADQRALGERSARQRGCTGCHDSGDGTLAGRTQPLPGTSIYPSNITPDVQTGIGGWSDDDIARAIRAGLDDQGAPLCEYMPRFAALDAGELGALVVYLRSLGPVHRAVPPSGCDGVDPGGAIDAGAPDLSGPPLVRTDACSVRINEVQLAGVVFDSAQFVELYNPCPYDLDLDGARLVYRSSKGSTDVRLLPLDGVRLLPGDFYVAGSDLYFGPAEDLLRGKLAAHGGGLAVRDRGDVVLDTMGWGDADNAYVDGHAAPAPGAGSSISRRPDGQATLDDSLDFDVTDPSPEQPNF